MTQINLLKNRLTDLENKHGCGAGPAYEFFEFLEFVEVLEIYGDERLL